MAFSVKQFIKPPPLDFEPNRPAAVLCKLTACSDAQKAAVADLQEQFSLPKEVGETLMDSIMSEMKLGLERDNVSMRMLPTFVTGIPTGNEQGTYLALEVAGTEVRVAQLKLKGNRGQYSIHEFQYRIPDELIAGDNFNVMIDYITDCVDDFLRRVGSQDLFVYSMGVSFGVAIQQAGLRQGIILDLPQEYSYPDAIGKDVIQLLHDSIEKKGLAVKATALANDAVCTLLAQAYQVPTTTMAVLHGMGTNCAYVERLSKIAKFKSDTPSSSDETMIINTEWGNFDNERSRLPLTWFDRRCDRESVNPHYQIFEKMISAKYLGELTRLVLLYLVDSGLLFEADSSHTFNMAYTLDTTYMYACEADDSQDLEQVRVILETMMKIPETTLADRQIVKKVCEIVGVRSAELVATAMAGVLRLIVTEGVGIGPEGITVATSGDLLELYPGFYDRVHDTLNMLVGDLAPKITMVVVKSSRLVGSAIIAMMAEKG